MSGQQKKKEREAGDGEEEGWEARQERREKNE